MRDKNCSYESDPFAGKQQPLSLAEILEAERCEIDECLEKLEERRPDHLSPLNEQIAFGREAARLRGMGDMLLRITKATIKDRE